MSALAGRAAGPVVPARLRRAVAAAALMVAVALLSGWIKPSRLLVEKTGEPVLEDLAPKAFGDWVLESVAPMAVVSPEFQSALERAYSQTVSRVYVHRTSGRRLMFVLAYGRDQTTELQLHTPEACYPAYGFHLMARRHESLEAGGTVLPVVRVEMQAGSRYEPVTYWVMVGDRPARGSRERNLIRIQYGLEGYIPDGMLVRVSEVNRDAAASYRLQDEFLRSLLAAASPESRVRLAGAAAAQRALP